VCEIRRRFQGSQSRRSARRWYRRAICCRCDQGRAGGGVRSRRGNDLPSPRGRAASIDHHHAGPAHRAALLLCRRPSLARERGRREKRGKLFGPSRLQFLTAIGATRTYWRSGPSQHHRMLPRVVGAVLGRRFFKPPAGRGARYVAPFESPSCSGQPVKRMGEFLKAIERQCGWGCCLTASPSVQDS
jgi:hypothetical protein